MFIKVKVANVKKNPNTDFTWAFISLYDYYELLGKLLFAFRKRCYVCMYNIHQFKKF